jgi:hypothetical protein
VNTRAGVFRFLAYAVLVGGVSLFSAEVAKRLPPTGLVGIDALIAQIQLALLIVCSGIFAWIGLRDRLRRPVAIAFIALFGFGLIRELQDILDRLVTDNFWQASAALLLTVASVYLYRHRERLVGGWQRSWPSAGLAILLAGLMLAILFVPILFAPDLWQPLLETRYPRRTVRLLGEVATLGAYLVILVGSLEFLYAWSRLPQTREMDRPRRRRVAKRRR